MPRTISRTTFPVHPKVAMAKNQLLVAFRKGTLTEYARAHQELERLLAIHHPAETRPAEQQVRIIYGRTAAGHFIRAAK